MIWSTSGWTTALVFVVALAAFHIRLVWLSPLSKAGWKRVDYYWLALGALGLVGASSQARETAINSYSRVVDGFYQGFDPVQYAVGTSRERLTQRRQVVDQPPDVKLAYEAWEKWLNDVHDRVAASVPGARIDESVLANEPIVLVEGAASATKDIRQAIHGHNQWVERRTELGLATKQSMGEDILRLFSPVLLALALALRITKVTGELRLD
ncbi:MAG TPA: hypothetical protein VNZ03_37270 [Terriglobales bacterium]|nr:hypothetical protein [Terriglobales bacterium]